MKRMPDNIVEVAETMIARGVDKADLDYALELVMTSSPAREQGLQIPLLERLMQAGATPPDSEMKNDLAWVMTANCCVAAAPGLPSGSTQAPAMNVTVTLPASSELA